LRPTLSGGLPFSGFDENPYLINMFVLVSGIILSRVYYRIYPEILEGKKKGI
jgi:preprotein translocase subunit Sec63